MYYLLFIICFAVCCYIITHTAFTRNSGLSNFTLLILFAFKVAAGLCLGWIAYHYYPKGSDYEALNYYGQLEYEKLVQHPGEFFSDLFRSGYKNAYGGMFEPTGSYWNDLKNNIILKILAFTNVVSRGNYYINSLLFNFIGFFGHVALYRVFRNIYKERADWPLIIGCFLLPSMLYFSSGIHKDNIAFTSICFTCYCLYHLFYQQMTIKRWLILFISIIFLFLVRNYVIIAMIPAVIAWWLCTRTNSHPLKLFGLVYGTFIIALLSMQVIVPSFKPLKIMVDKQQAFTQAPAKTAFAMDSIQPVATDMISHVPLALNHSLMRPYLWEHPSSWGSLAIAIELFLYQLVFMAFLILGKKNRAHPFIYFGIAIALSACIIIGLIVPNAGSVARYRSLFLPFLITPLLIALYRRKIIYYK